MIAASVSVFVLSKEVMLNEGSADVLPVMAMSSNMEEAGAPGLWRPLGRHTTPLT